MIFLPYLLVLQHLTGVHTPLEPSIPCLTTINVRAIICPNKQDSFSVKYCPKCDGCCLVHGIRSADKNYSIISFKIRGEKLCGEPFEMETVNTGAAWNEAQGVINRACAGSIVKFTCIKAKDKNGNIHVLRPLTIQL